jgi:hypothetical protein
MSVRLRIVCVCNFCVVHFVDGSVVQIFVLRLGGWVGDNNGGWVIYRSGIKGGWAISQEVLSTPGWVGGRVIII